MAQQETDFGPLVGAIDQGTSSTRFLVFASKTSEVLSFHQVEVKQSFPKEGWVEEDPKEILATCYECFEQVVENLRKMNIDPANIKALGITNQRETTVVWDRITGEPLYPAIIWLDTRTGATVQKLVEKTPGQNKDYLQNFTGGKNGGLHITDSTNASRTMLMNINTLQWDDKLCSFFDIPKSLLPEIRSSAEVYGNMEEGILKGVPISGILGDQQAALVGQTCLKKEWPKNTYGTGCFLLYNTGEEPVLSKNGLLTTVAYQLGKDAPVIYALEGSVAISGAAVRWLRDNLGIIKETKDIESLAASVEDCGGVYFVPAFSGLYAPYWQTDARGIICGLTQYSNKAHIARAVLEAVCFQTKELLEAMDQDSGIPLVRLQVDGGMTANQLLMQLQADLLNIPVVRPSMPETTALGAAMAAGHAVGVWSLAPEDLTAITTDVFSPTITEETRYSKWKLAVEKSMHWEGGKATGPSQDGILSSVSPSLYLMGTFGLLLLAKTLASRT